MLASRAERAAASARRDIAENQNGTRVFAGTGLTDANEPVTDTYVRNYRRANLTIGVRWTLLAGRLSQKQNVKQAEWDIARAQMREDMAGNDAVRQVRVAAVKAAYADQRAALANAFLTERERVQGQIQARRQSGTMLGAEAMELATLNDEVNAQLKRQKQAQQDSEQAIRRIAGIEGKLDLSTPAWPETCFDTAHLMREDGRGQEAEQQLNVAAASSQMKLLDGGILNSVEAGVQVSHSRMKDWPGQDGRNSGVHLDVAVPLGWRQVRDARIGEWSAKRQQAEAQLQEARSLRQYDIDKGLRERALLKSEWTDAQTRLKAAQESLRVANLRRPALQGEGIVEQFQARMAAYKASVRVVDAAEKYSLAEAELLALGPECATQEQPKSASAVTPQLLASLGASQTQTVSDAGNAAPVMDTAQQQAAAPVAQAPRAGANPNAKPPTSGKPEKPAQSVASMRSKIGWFVWDGQKLLSDPSRLDQLPAHSGRLLLSFTAQQLQKMRAEDWKDLRARANQRGMRLELLLGDPGWVTPKGRPTLISLLTSVQGLPVDGLNIDLERSQLPKNSMTQEQWKREATATIREVRAVTPWELALTTHHRDLDDAAFLSALRSAGLNEVVPMIYTQNAKRAAQLTEDLLAHSSGLHVSLAQSIEPILSKEESSFHQGRSRSVQRWTALSKDLSRNPLFSGVIVQSMADYQQAKP
ncbi:TolC family protein [Diaphorobacter aerolatus]|uniref:TolC family protein n=1 Tax=Diaphorobacter aerolatus TaxID=1288495 RepID=A0A7H0GL86_9BURK|nr:TolC family protein [Diaphorobacter aerolatus]QNP49052.1 TolC family protein [Diaphorobacter aerolatus]